MRIEMSHPTAGDESAAAGGEGKTETLLPAAAAVAVSVDVTVSGSSTIAGAIINLSAAAAPPCPEVAVNIDAVLVNRMGKKLLDFYVTKENPRELEALHTIYRVIPSVRREDEAAYDPKIISIGPFHRRKDELRPAEDLKWQFLKDLLARSPFNSLDRYAAAARSLEHCARRRYAEEIPWMSSDEFVEMLVLDGCFIVELLAKTCYNEKPGKLYGVNWVLPLLRNDLLLVENQIPFFVISELYGVTEIGGELSGLSITTMAFLYLHPSSDRKEPSALQETEFYHLLHLFQWSLRPGTVDPPSMPPPESTKKKTKELIGRCCGFLLDFLSWVVSLVIFCLARLPSPAAAAEMEQKKERTPRMIPSATELQAAGVEFRRRREGAECFLNVSFRSGVMEIPQLSVQGTSASLFRNLMAFEQCCPAGAGNHFTAYMMFVDYLINTPQDVAVLESKGVIESKLGSNKELVVFFNTLCRGGYLDFEDHYLVGLFRDVKRYNQTDRHRWRATLMSTYFSSPWAMISFVAAAFAIALTALQTVYTVYAYYRPPAPAPN